MAKTPKRPRDPNQLAKLIVDVATGEDVDIKPDATKDPVAVSRGRAGGEVGGKARAQALSPDQRRRIAQTAAKARWDRSQQ